LENACFRIAFGRGGRAKEWPILCAKGGGGNEGERTFYRPSGEISPKRRKGPDF